MSYFNPSTSSGSLAASVAVTARPCILKSVMVQADATHAATVTVYDNATTNSGTVLAQVLIPATGVYAVWSNTSGVEADKGLYVLISGTGATAVVHYSAE